MSAYFIYDFSRLSYDDLIAVMAKCAEGPAQLESARWALEEFRRRRGEYVQSRFRALRAHIAAHLNAAEFLAAIFENVMREARNYRRPGRFAGPAKELQWVNRWIKGVICGSILSESTDKQLMAQIAWMGEGGAEAKLARRALWEIQERHGPEVLAYCHSLVRRKGLDAGLAHDLMQNTFLKLPRVAGTYDDKGCIDQENMGRLTCWWLNTIACHLLADMLREQKRRKQISLDHEEGLEAIRLQDKARMRTRARGEKDEGEDAAGGASRQGRLHKECMRRAIEGVRLSERERDIIDIAKRTDFPTERERRHALRELRRKYNLKDGNKRKILMRAIAKFEDHAAAECDGCRQVILKERERRHEEWRRKQEQKEEQEQEKADKGRERKKADEYNTAAEDGAADEAT